MFDTSYRLFQPFMQNLSYIGTALVVIGLAFALAPRPRTMRSAPAQAHSLPGVRTIGFVLATIGFVLAIIGLAVYPIID